MEKLLYHLLPGSSDVDWCESNYSISSLVAEFYNTVSNALFFVLPPLLIYLFRQYARQVSWGINLVWALLLIVGVGSVYFHATLSLVGQLLDEIAIIWVFMAAFALWFPRRYMPLVFQQNRNRFKVMVGFCTALSSGLACVMPAVNCVALFVLAVPATTLMIIELRRCKEQHVVNLGVRCCLMWVMALASWISDNVFCDVWSRLGFPYLHCVWHVCIALASYQALVLFAYFDAIAEVPEMMPVLQYWPRGIEGIVSWMGIPYVTFKCVGPKPTMKMY